MSDIERAAAEAVRAARQSDEFAVMLAAIQTQAIQQRETPQVVHIHQAPPDRTVQRVALGAGMGAGAVGASVYFGPLLVAAMTSMAISLGVLALVITVTAWAIVRVVGSVGGADGRAAAETLKGRRRRRR